MADEGVFGEITNSESRRVRGGSEQRSSGRASSSEPEMWQTMSRLPSSSAESYRSISPEPRPEPGREPRPEDEQQTWWKFITKSVVSGMSVAVGLKPTQSESRHWDIVKGLVLGEVEGGGEEVDGSFMQTSHHPRDRSIVRHASRREFSPFSSFTQTSVVPDASYFAQQFSIGQQQAMMSVQSYRQNKSTGRNQAISTELKPDLWKVVLSSIKTHAKKSAAVELVEIPGVDRRRKKSFMFGEEEEDEVDADIDGHASAPFSLTPTILEQEEEDFFGKEISPYEETDSAPAASVPPSLMRLTSVTVKVQPGSTIVEEKVINSDPHKTKDGRRGRVKELWGKVTLSGGYLSGYGGLGGVSKLLQLKYKHLTPEIQRDLDSQFLHKRPYFTYWLMLVHAMVMVIALAVYGFAPYGWDLIEERAIVRQTDLSSATVSKMVVSSVWLGPPQQALVLLGALFTPCMRKDSQLFMGIEGDRTRENLTSGCCVHRDRSGCFQTTEQFCQKRFSDFHLLTNKTRAVCGTSPDTCLEPSRSFSTDIWDPLDILTWPICFLDTNANATDPHLTCEVTSRPCCYGIQANCIITTREQCNFLSGGFHQDAFLCSQVDCLNDICGLLPFREFNQPDQFYRLWLAIFLHAGLLHLFLSLTFSFFILRHVEKRLGWLRTSTIYILSGIGGNLVSAYAAPYNPQVGPAGSVLGIVAFFFVFLVFESRLLLHPLREALKLMAVCGVLFFLGLFPYIDNYAHFGGFMFGFLISGVLVPYGSYKEVWRLTKQDERKDKYFVIVKKVLIVVGVMGSVMLLVLFFVLLYEVQTTWIGLSYLTCIPFTSTLCIDQQAFIRVRNQLII